eukprot:5347321-Amphidinium_carterae.1
MRACSAPCQSSSAFPPSRGARWCVARVISHTLPPREQAVRDGDPCGHLLWSDLTHLDPPLETKVQDLAEGDSVVDAPPMIARPATVSVLKCALEERDAQPACVGTAVEYEEQHSKWRVHLDDGSIKVFAVRNL